MKAAATYLAITLQLIIGNAYAQQSVTTKAYKDTRQTDMLQTYVSGIGRGIMMANSVLLAEKKSTIYCPGDKMLGRDIFLSIIDQEIVAPSPGMKYEVDTPIEIILMHGIIRRYPCK